MKPGKPKPAMPCSPVGIVAAGGKSAATVDPSVIVGAPGTPATPVRAGDEGMIVPVPHEPVERAARPGSAAPGAKDGATPISADPAAKDGATSAFPGAGLEGICSRPTDAEEVVSTAETPDQATRQASCDVLIGNWTKYGTDGPLNIPTNKTRHFELRTSTAGNLSPKASVWALHVHEVIHGAQREVKPVFTVRGTVKESAFGDSDVLAKLDYKGNPHRIHHDSLDVRNEQGGASMRACRDQITKAIIASEHGCQIAAVLNKKKLHGDDVKHGYESYDGWTFKAYVGTWKPKAETRSRNPLDDHVPPSNIPIGHGQTYAPAVLCTAADGTLLDNADASATIAGKCVKVFYKMEFAVGWSKKEYRKFLYINAKPLGVQVLGE